MADNDSLSESYTDVSITGDDTKQTPAAPKGKKEKIGDLVGIPGYLAAHLTVHIPPPPYASSSSRPQKPPQTAVLFRPAPHGQGDEKVGVDKHSKEITCYFLIGKGSHRYNCIVNTLRRAGLREVPQACPTWNVRWDSYLQPDQYKRLKPYQKTNHFPGSWLLGNKSYLASSVQKMARLHRDTDFSFLPETYVFPSDRSMFKSRMAPKSSRVWIVKPKAAACGRGIRLVTSAKEIPRKQDCVVCRYVSNPYLIDGRKFDLRIYVLVTSFNPLKVYQFGEGLVRFAVHKYSMKTSSLKSRLAHLTNYSLNKKSKDYVKNSSTHDAAASKWKLTALEAYLEQNGVSWRPVLERIHGVIIKSLMSVEPEIRSRVARLGAPPNSLFELYGYDVLLDEHLQPHLLEVNVKPSFSSSSALDKQIKVGLVSDMFHLLGIAVVDPLKDTGLRRRSSKRGKKGARTKSLGRRKLKKTLPSASSSTALQQTSKDHSSTSAVTDTDLQVLQAFAGELDRLGNFECIYPTPKNTAKYSNLLSPRPLNILLQEWLEMDATDKKAVLTGAGAITIGGSTGKTQKRRGAKGHQRMTSDRVTVKVRPRRKVRSRGSARFQ